MRTHLICLAMITAATLAVPITGATSPVDFPPCEITTPADVVLLLDRSGSMAGGGLAAVQDSVSYLLGRMRATDHSALVDYDEVATIDKSLDNNHAATDAQVQLLSPRGGTATGLGIDMAHSEFTANQRAGVAHAMIVLTDGQTNSGPNAATEAAQAKADGIIIYAIGYGNGINAAELQAIASDASTTYYNPLTPAELDQVFEQITDEIVGLQDATADAHNLFVEVTEPAIPGIARIDRVHHVVAPDDQYQETASFSFTEAGLAMSGTLVWASASTTSETNRATATGQAAIHDLRIDFLGAPLLYADVVTAYAHADAQTGNSASGTDGVILGLQVESNTYEVTPTSISTLYGNILFLDSTTSTTSNTAQAQMDAIHILLYPPTGETIEVVVSHAYAGAQCGEGDLTPPPPPTDDPILPACLLGTPVEVPVSPANVVEVELCYPCPSETPQPGKLPRMDASSTLAAAPGVPGPDPDPEGCIECPSTPQVIDTNRIDPCNPDCLAAPGSANLIDACVPDPCPVLTLLGLHCAPDPCDNPYADPCDVTFCFGSPPPTLAGIKHCIATGPDAQPCRDLLAKPVDQISSSDVKACLVALAP